MPPLFVLLLVGFGCAFLGAMGGGGGATLLVAALLLLEVDPLSAAPLGMIVVGALSLAAASRQIDERLVHHRIGLSVELVASLGTVAGALLSTRVEEVWLARMLAAAAMAGAIAAIARKGIRNKPAQIFDNDPAGEWPGTLGGTYSLNGSAVPYHAQRVPLGLIVALIAGVVSGLAGVGGGFLKTPAMSEVMRIPVKVAAATSTFISGMTAATGLLVYVAQGRVDVHAGTSIVVGALAGGFLGARQQTLIKAQTARRFNAGLLMTVALVVIARTV